MKEKASITLSREVLAGVDQLAGSQRSRSAFIERVLRGYLSQRARRALNARDVERINGSAAQLNTEAEDVLDYQFSPESDGEL
jgi:metal-responsive CopG/Arc/MetJ family transcriptional regulator